MRSASALPVENRHCTCWHPLTPTSPHPCCMCGVQDQWDTVKRQVQELTASSQYSNQPAIYGMVAGAEAARLRGEVPGGEGGCCTWRPHAHSNRRQHACACGRALALSLSHALAPLQACQIPGGMLCPFPESHHASRTVSCPACPAASAAVPLITTWRQASPAATR